MEYSTTEVGDIIERCGRETVRFVGTLDGDVIVAKGDGATLYYEKFRTEIKWLGEQGKESTEERTSNDFPFNVVRVARDVEGKKMHLIFFSEHNDYVMDIDDLESDDEIDSDEKSETTEETKSSEAKPETEASKN